MRNIFTFLGSAISAEKVEERAEDVSISKKDDNNFVVNIEGSEPKVASSRPKNKKKKGSKH